jgi:serine/threonine protein kinase
MRTSSPGVAAQSRFRREADALARLRHPGIAQIFTAGCHRLGIVDVPYYVMEFIPGAESLVQACERRRVPLRSRLELLLEVCEAVAQGHAEGIVHRDLKPGNILVDAGGKPKIIDFGIARMDGAEADNDGPRTETGQFIGTRPYMAPEQFMEHPATIDARTDVYAVGVVMHELLSGRLPYDVAGKSLV